MICSGLRAQPVIQKLLAFLLVTVTAFYAVGQDLQAQEQVLYLSIVDNSGTPDY